MGRIKQAFFFYFFTNQHFLTEDLFQRKIGKVCGEEIIRTVKYVKT